MSTSEQSDRFIAGLIRHLGIPHLGRPPAMDAVGDHRCSVQLTIRGQQVRADREPAGQASWLHAEEFDAEQARQTSLVASVELVDDGYKGKYRRF